MRFSSVVIAIYTGHFMAQIGEPYRGGDEVPQIGLNKY
jgi:hypothetical protein